MKNVKNYEANPVQKGLLLNANENPNNLMKSTIDKICLAMQSVDFNRYPDNDAITLRKAYSRYIGVDYNQIIVGNGSDELLGLLISIYLGNGKKLLTLSPDFSMYDYYATMQDARVIKFKTDIDKPFDVDGFIEMGKAEKVDLILFSNPNNPTGKEIDAENILQIVQSFPDICVVVDEAYGEFGTFSMLPYIETNKNLLVTRTLSKAFGLAGLRCGFLLGNRQLINKINAYKVPYNVNIMTQICATVVLEDIDKIKVDIDMLKKLRDEMYNSYQEMNLKNCVLYISNGNYIYGKCNDLNRLKNLFDKENIIIRYYDDNFRITIGRKEDNERVLNILKSFG